MKLRLPILLQAALLSALAFVSQPAQAYGNSSFDKQGGTASSGGGIYSSSASYELLDYESILFSLNKATGYMPNGNGGAIAVDNLTYSNNFGILLNNNGSILFSENTANRYGGALYVYDGRIGIQLNGNQSVSFQKNTAQTAGGAIASDTNGGALELKNNGDITFFQNSSTSSTGNGGAIYLGSASGKLDISGNTGTVKFEGNTANMGGAIFNESSYDAIELTENKDLIFTGNTSSGHGGAIHNSTRSRAIVSIIGNTGIVKFENNRSTGTWNNGLNYNGGAIYVGNSYADLSDNKEVVFSGNETKGAAGGIYAYAGLVISGNGSVLFSGNKGGWGASALAGGGLWMDISGNGEVRFEGNLVEKQGAALYTALRKGTNVDSFHRLSADEGNITFDGNLQNTNNGNMEVSRLGVEGVIDAGYDKARFILQAKGDLGSEEAKSIYFYDAVLFSKYVNGEGSDGGSSLTVDLNPIVGYGGNIVFSGEKNGGKELVSHISGDVNLYGGTLKIQDKAHLFLHDVHTTAFGGGGFTETNIKRNFAAYGGAVLEMTRNGRITAGDVSFDQHSVLRTETGTSLNVDSIVFNNGITFDIAPFLGTSGSVSGTDGNGKPVNGTSGLNVSAGSWDITGMGTIHLSDTLNFNADDRWASNQRFLLLVDTDGSRGEADFDQIISNLTGSNVIGSGYAYKGEWTYEWVGNSLYAVWEREKPARGELWWDGEGAGSGNGLGVWNQDPDNKVWNLNAPDGIDFDFQDYDIVHFTRSGVVDINGFVEVGKVRPGGVIQVHFDDGKGELFWQGIGSIVGSASMEKYGTGVLVIRTNNTFSGGTQMYGGTIRVESKTGLGTGDVTLHGGLIDLGGQGLTNTITVVGNGALAGVGEGSVTVNEKAVLNFLGGMTYSGGLDSSNYIKKAVLVKDTGTVNIQAGSVVNGYINLEGADSILNLVAGNGGTSLFNGAVLGEGVFNVVSGKHQIKEADTSHGQTFDGQVNIQGGELTVSSDLEYKDVLMTGGMLVADSHVIFDNLVVGDTDAGRAAHQKTTVKVNAGDHVYMGARDVVVNGNATFAIEGVFNALGETHVKAGGNILVNSNSRSISWGMVYDELSPDGLTSSRIEMTDNTSVWNANGGFTVHYIDAKTGMLTIGSDSIILENGYFYAENIVYGTDKNGNILEIGTPAEDTPTLTISRGSTFWAGNTTQVLNESGNWVYQTQTGFQCVQLNIEALVTIGTFVVQGASDNHMTHAGILESMEKAFTPLFDPETMEDPRFYLYVLKENVRYSADEIKKNETVHVDTGADAVIEQTKGTILNIDGVLKVNDIDATTGSVTAAGGQTDLTQATADKGNIHFIGSYNTAAPDKGEGAKKEAEIRLVEDTPNAYTVKVDTVQAAIGETTKVGRNSLVAAQNFIIAGSETVLDNDKGTLTVDKEVTLEDTAAYKVGARDQFGWVNMNQGDLNLTRSVWNDITLGSYSGETGETAAKVRLNEGKENNVDAKALNVVAGNEHTLVTEGNTVSTDKLTAGKDSFLDVKGGKVNVRETLLFEESVRQSGTISLVQKELSEEQKAKARISDLASSVLVSFGGGNNVGTIDSTAGTGLFHHVGFNNMEGYNSAGNDTWVFVLTDELLESQNPENALTKIAEQEGKDLTKIIVDTSKLTKSYLGDIQVYSDNITLKTKDVDYGEAVGTYNQKDAIKNFAFVNPVIPEVGDITINSLWTMVSAMDSFTSAIYGQLNFAAYRQTPSRNIWAKAIYMNENIGNALPGYRKDSGGYAVGCDTAVGKKSILGVGFAQMMGTEMTNRGMGKDKQDILMGMLYGRTILESCDKGATTLDYMVGYGYGDNKGKFFRGNGTTAYSTGNWDSNVFNAAVRSTWYRKLNNSFSLNPYVGGEFVFAEHEAHTIRGGAGDFQVGRSRTHALRLPIGTTLEHKNILSTVSSLTEYIGVCYVPDILRSNPSATVTNGMVSRVSNDVNVGRNAVRTYAGTTWQIDQNWLINLNYEVEAASRKVNQTGRITVNYTF